MRRKKKDNISIKSRLLKIVSFFLIFSIFFITSAYALSNQIFSITGTAAIINNGDCPLDVDFNYEVTASWQNYPSGYNHIAKLTVTNNSNTNIHGWTITLKGPSDLGINNMNAEYSIDNGEATITPTGNYTWAADINSGSSRTIEIPFTTSESELKLSYLFFNSCMVITGSDTSPLLNFTIENPNVTIKTGQSSQIKINKMPVDAQADFSYVSANSQVATVSQSGEIIGVSPGTTVITVTANGIAKTIQVEVTSETVELTSISISPKDNTIKVGETKTLIVTKEPADAGANVSFTSSNPSVATVDSNGKITALSTGKTTITVTSGNLQDTANVTVIQDATSNDLDFNFSHQYYYGNSIQFTINIANIGYSEIKKISFRISFPDGTTWNYWQNWPAVFQADANGNKLTSTGTQFTLASGSYTTFTGSVTLPNGYLAEDYLSPTIYDVEVE